MDLPERLGKYLLIDRIAVGGMAEIFRARTAGLGGFEKVLAIKRLHSRYCEDGDFIKMLIDEAKIAVQLSHSNIGQIFDLDHLDEHYFICMEFIDGRDLHRVIRRLNDRQRTMPLEMACHVAKEVCSGLDYAHRKVAPDGTPLRIIHRDVSPQNILISWEGEVKVVDFGIAKAARRAYETESGIIKGKFYYMSPEQARGEEIDHRSDIFSLGVVLYEALTGQLLYTEDDGETLINRVRAAHIQPPSRLRKKIPGRLDQIVMKALARNPDERYQSAAAFGDALTRFIHQSAPEWDRMALAEFMRELFDEVLVGSEPAQVADDQAILSRVEYRAEPSSLIHTPSDGTIGGSGAFEVDPFFSDEASSVEDGSAMSSKHPPYGGDKGRDSEINLIDEGDIEIIDDGYSADLPPDPADDQPTEVHLAPGTVIDDLGTLRGTVATGLDDEMDREPTRIYKPQAVLAASPGADHGPLRGESRIEQSRREEAEAVRLRPSQEATVITSIDSVVEPDDGLPAPPVRRRSSPVPALAHPRRSGEYRSVRSSPSLMIGLFVLVLALGAALAFGIQLFFTGDDEAQTTSVQTTEIPQPVVTPTPAFASYYVTSHPTGARVLLAGDFMGATPTTVEGLQVGQTYALRLEHEGHQPYEQVLRPTTAGTHSVAFTLDRLLGAVAVTTDPPSAAVSLDGRFIQNAPAEIPGLDTTTTYFVSASMPGYQTAHQRIEWPPGSSATIPVHLALTPVEPPPSLTPAQTAPVAATTPEPNDEPRPTPARTAARETDDDRDERRTASHTSSRHRDRDEDEVAERESRDRDRDDEDRTASRTTSRDRDRDDEVETAATEPSGPGLISVQADPEAHVFIDGQVVSTETPLNNYELEAGTHRVKVYFVSLRRFSEERRVRVVAGETRSVHFNGEEEEE